MNKNQYDRSRNILESLIQGVHPTTGEDLPKNTIVIDIEVTRALFTSITALKQVQARALRRAQLPEKVGRTWSQTKRQLCAKSFKLRFP